MTANCNSWYSIALLYLLSCKDSNISSLTLTLAYCAFCLHWCRAVFRTRHQLMLRQIFWRSGSAIPWNLIYFGKDLLTGAFKLRNRGYLTYICWPKNLNIEIKTARKINLDKEAQVCIWELLCILNEMSHHSSSSGLRSSFWTFIMLPEDSMNDRTVYRCIAPAFRPGELLSSSSSSCLVNFVIHTQRDGCASNHW